MNEQENAEAIRSAWTLQADRSGSSFALSSKCQEERLRIQLPVPHPLDFDWRFSEESLRLFLDYVEKLCFPNKEVALLGTPTIVRAALQSDVKRAFVLIEASDALLRSFRALSNGTRLVKCDLFVDPLPLLSAQLVIADAPWYEDYMQVFVWAASCACKTGGTVLLTKPPVGTRPTIEAEWARILQFCYRVGLTFRDLQEGVLKYVSPPFERNALRAGKNLDLGPLWRRGDLAILERTHDCSVERPRSLGLLQAWEEQELQGVRWRIRKDASTTFADPWLISITPGDILSSVSRRDSRRELAEVWTSGNRIFRCHGRSILKLIIGAIRERVMPSEAVSGYLLRELTVDEGQKVKYAVRQVEEIVNSELGEYLLAWSG